jgi:deoxycytidylate deaminase
MAAIIAVGSKPVSLGCNQKKSHPKQKTLYNPGRSIHAELAAVIGCSLTALDGATIYVARHYNDGSPALAKPCPRCMELLVSVGIKKAVYTTGGTAENPTFETLKVQEGSYVYR